jgi:hypothetical protein
MNTSVYNNRYIFATRIFQESPRVTARFSRLFQTQIYELQGLQDHHR